MREISLHIMDIAENGIRAGANLVHIMVNENRKENILNIEVQDNGSGIPEEMVDKVIDPFVTSRTTRRVGLGLSLLKDAAQRCDGDFKIVSEPDKGTRVSASFKFDHIDRAPVGDMAGSLNALFFGNPKIDFIYEHYINNRQFSIDTRDLKDDKDNRVLSDPAMIYNLTQLIREQLVQLENDNGSLQEKEDKK